MDDALQWIAEHARFRRYIPTVELRSALGRQKGHCTWCDTPVGKGRSRWCSEPCREEGYVRSGMWTRSLVEMRDKGICALCGFDGIGVQLRVHAIDRRAYGTYDPVTRRYRHFCYTFARIRKFSRRTGIYPTGQPYEIDHVTPVVEGGGCCGLDGLRTLCFACHRVETKKLAGRRSKIMS